MKLRVTLAGIGCFAAFTAFACREVDTVSDDNDGSTSAATSSSTVTTGASTSASSSSGGGPCTGDACGYAVMSLVTGAPRFALLKMDKVRDLCFQLVMVGGAGDVVFDGTTGVETARVTSESDDCIPWGAGFPPEPLGDVVDATGLIGTLSLALGDPCVVDVDAAMTFSNAPAWVPSSEPLIASDLQMINNCP